MPIVAVTGADGFVGWHTRVLAHTLAGVDARPIGRATMNDAQALGTRVDGVDHVVHCAGANRGDESDIYWANVQLAQQLAAALVAAANPPYSLTFANSTQTGSDSGYGQGKARAAGILAEACAATGVRFRDVLLPALFGEHGRPGYNSVVATFCDAIVAGRPAEISDDKELSLLGVRDGAGALLGALSESGPMPSTTTIEVSALLELILEFDAHYRTGDIPRLDTRFRTQLFNTYRAFTFPGRFPIPLARRDDSRGCLVETVRAHGGCGQSFVSTTHPGATRGQHFHLDKVERFVVVEGDATISLRRVLFDEVITFQVSGDRPVIVDMPTLWTHNITNVGTKPLITQFWTNQIFDAAAPDTYYEAV